MTDETHNAIFTFAIALAYCTWAWCGLPIAILTKKHRRRRTVGENTKETIYETQYKYRSAVKCGNQRGNNHAQYRQRSDALRRNHPNTTGTGGTAVWSTGTGTLRSALEEE
jgi:hypothetical protein